MIPDFNKLEQAGPEIYIFTGHYGSGKTELAVNFAEYLKKLHPEREVAIADMDIVNPFFRTADAAEALRKRESAWSFRYTPSPTWMSPL